LLPALGKDPLPFPLGVQSGSGRQAFATLRHDRNRPDDDSRTASTGAVVHVEYQALFPAFCIVNRMRRPCSETAEDQCAAWGPANHSRIRVTASCETPVGSLLFAAWATSMCRAATLPSTWMTSVSGEACR
jgi:hypothetical protein